MTASETPQPQGSYKYQQQPKDPESLPNVLQRYEQERDSRLRPEGGRQYVNLETVDGCGESQQDPWIATGTPVNQVIPDGGHTKVLIAGAGFAGLQCAAKLIKSGCKPQDILMVDPAGGFGGTWYWNRYPGLQCDTESYVYMPFLEDLDYMPTKKYASGQELRSHADAVATHFGLQERAMLQTSAKAATWDDRSKEWAVKLLQQPKGGIEKTITINADFLVLVPGIFTSPKLPKVSGINDFEGHYFHTSRWDYAFTKGSDIKPDLTGLQDKRVGIVGTGATAVQAIPHLARFAKTLHVFQRTPSAVDHRNQQPTDAQEWKSKIANKPGWQHERCVNFAGSFTGLKDSSRVDLVDDGWSNAGTYYALAGGPNDVTYQTIGDHTSKVHMEDYPRSERIRQRVTDVVRDAETAEKLKAWYPTWCKRPTFHDEYLETFNQPNVKLVDTGRKGVQSITSAGPVVNNEKYPVDVLIWGTGFEIPSGQSSAEKCNMTVLGKDGLPMSQKSEQGFTTLHGVMTAGFPNLCFIGTIQSGVSPNFLFASDIISDHIAYIIGEGMARSEQACGASKAVIDVQAEAEEAYAQKIASMALVNAPVGGCTPSYYNYEGALTLASIEEQVKSSRFGIWGQGLLDYNEYLKAWRESGKMEGMHVSLHEVSESGRPRSMGQNQHCQSVEH